MKIFDGPKGREIVPKYQRSLATGNQAGVDQAVRDWRRFKQERANKASSAVKPISLLLNEYLPSGKYFGNQAEVDSSEVSKSFTEYRDSGKFLVNQAGVEATETWKPFIENAEHTQAKANDAASAFDPTIPPLDDHNDSGEPSSTLVACSACEAAGQPGQIHKVEDCPRACSECKSTTEGHFQHCSHHPKRRQCQWCKKAGKLEYHARIDCPYRPECNVCAQAGSPGQIHSLSNCPRRGPECSSCGSALISGKHWAGCQLIKPSEQRSASAMEPSSAVGSDHQSKRTKLDTDAKEGSAANPAPFLHPERRPSDTDSPALRKAWKAPVGVMLIRNYVTVGRDIPDMKWSVFLEHAQRRFASD